MSFLIVCQPSGLAQRQRTETETVSGIPSVQLSSSTDARMPPVTGRVGVPRDRRGYPKLSAPPPSGAKNFCGSAQMLPKRLEGVLCASVPQEPRNRLEGVLEASESILW